MNTTSEQLFTAATTGDATSLENLLANGCDHTVKNGDGWSPLLVAAEKGHLKCVKLLLRAAFKDVPRNEISSRVWLPKSRDQHLILPTPISLAARNGHCEVLYTLIDFYHSFTELCDLGCALHGACKNKQTDCVRVLLCGLRQQINSPNDSWDLPIHIATREGNLEIVQLLKDCGSEMNEANKAGRTPLHIACLLGNCSLARLLITARCNVNARDTKCGTPLLYAVMSQKLELVELLLDKGADPTVSLEHTITSSIAKEMTPLAAAAEAGNLEILKVLARVTPRQHGPVATALAACKHNNDCLRYLFKKRFPTFTKAKKWEKNYFGDVWEYIVRDNDVGRDDQVIGADDVAMSDDDESIDEGDLEEMSEDDISDDDSDIDDDQVIDADDVAASDDDESIDEDDLEEMSEDDISDAESSDDDSDIDDLTDYEDSENQENSYLKSDNDGTDGNDDHDTVDSDDPISETVKILLDNGTTLPWSTLALRVVAHIPAVRIIFERGDREFDNIVLKMFKVDQLQPSMTVRKLLLRAFATFSGKEHAYVRKIIELNMHFFPFATFSGAEGSAVPNSQLCESIISTVPNLTDLCRWSIRSFFVWKNKSISPKDISRLPLPNTLKRFLIYH